MEPSTMAKQMISFQKTVFDNSFNALAVVQDQTETMIKTFMGQFPMVTEESKKQLDETLEYTRKARDEFKKSVDEGYERIESLFDQK
ncbi:MAG: hypothetical protein HUN04_19965 [Desulfobacter sp.]|nr:MAG: hypothetical protein HUN04_19965 [Desulfobacter sp.]